MSPMMQAKLSTALGLVTALIVLVSTFWAGGRSLAAVVTMATLSVLALVLAYVIESGVRVRWSPVAVGLFTLGLFALLQCVPLPPALMRLVNPVGETTRDQLALGSAWHPLSNEVSATIRTAARLFGLGAFAMALSRVASGSNRQLLTAVLVLAFGGVVLCAGMTAFGFPLPAFIVGENPKHGLAFPFVNFNHAATLLAGLFPLVLARMITQGDARRKIALIVLAIVGNIALVATRSRAGIGLGVAGEIATLWLLVDKTDFEYPRPLRILTALSALLLLSALFLKHKLVEHAYSSMVQSAQFRWQAVDDALHLARDYLWFGVGPGAFTYAFNQYSRFAGTLRYGFVENEYLQLLIDFGIIGIVALVAGLWFSWRKRSRLSRKYSLTERAACAGLVVIALHNAIDFSWEMTGIAVVVCGLAAVLAPSAGSQLKIVGLVACALGTMSVVAVAASPLGRSADEDIDRLAAITDPVAFKTSATAAFARHPYDGFLAEVVANRLIPRHDPDMAKWLERAIVLDPRDPEAHRLCARAFALAGAYSQAAVELRLAFENITGQDSTLLRADAQRIFPTDEYVTYMAMALPSNEEAVVVVRNLAGAHQCTYAMKLAALTTEQLGSNPGIVRVGVDCAVQLKDIQFLQTWLPRLVDRDETAAGALLAAQAAVLLGDSSTAERELAAAMTRQPTTKVAVQLSSLLLARNDINGARDILADMLTRAMDADAKAALHDELVKVENAAGNIHRAAFEREAAAQLRNGASP